MERLHLRRFSRKRCSAILLGAMRMCARPAAAMPSCSAKSCLCLQTTAQLASPNHGLQQQPS